MAIPLQIMTDKNKTRLYKRIIELAENISESSLDKLFDSIIYRQVLKGENILIQGQLCKSIFFIENGYSRTFMVKDGIEINTDFTFEGNFTTNLKSLRLLAPSDTTIQAGENATMYEFYKDALLELYAESPDIESFGRRMLEQLLMAQEEHINLFKIFSPAERYQYLQANHPQMIQRISLSQLSSYLGVARETLSRIRKIK